MVNGAAELGMELDQQIPFYLAALQRNAEVLDLAGLQSVVPDSEIQVMNLQEQIAKREALLAFLRSSEAAWKDEDHPEFAAGAYAWVRGMREEERTFDSPVMPLR